MEIISLITLVASIVVAIAFFILVGNTSSINSNLKDVKEEQQKIYKALYQIAKMKMDERKEAGKPEVK